MTPDPISHAPESARDTTLTEFTQDQVKMGTARPESASDVLLAARQAGEQFGTNAVQRKLYGDIAEAGAKAAALADSTPAPTGDEVAELRAKLRSAEATIANALDRETQAIDENERLKAGLKVATSRLSDIASGACYQPHLHASAARREIDTALFQHQKGDGHGE